MTSAAIVALLAVSLGTARAGFMMSCKTYWNSFPICEGGIVKDIYCDLDTTATNYCPNVCCEKSCLKFLEEINVSCPVKPTTDMVCDWNACTLEGCCPFTCGDFVAYKAAENPHACDAGFIDRNAVCKLNDPGTGGCSYKTCCKKLECADWLKNRGQPCPTPPSPARQCSEVDSCSTSYCCPDTPTPPGQTTCSKWTSDNKAQFPNACANGFTGNNGDTVCIAGGTGADACSFTYCCNKLQCAQWLTFSGLTCPAPPSPPRQCSYRDSCSPAYCCTSSPPPPPPPPTTSTITNIVTITVPPASTIAPAVVTKLTTCSAAGVVCPAGQAFTSGHLSCLLTYVNSVLTSTTCSAAYCCSPTTGVRPIWTPGTCKDVACPAGTQQVLDAAGNALTCMSRYTGNVLRATTCTVRTCCVAVVVTPVVPVVPVTPVKPAKPTGLVPCNKHITCKVYKQDKKTKGVMRCKLSTGSSQYCSKKYCCVS